ncbi:TPM domain-containing protein [Chryseotalea sanaruensis]|nr:TPM domain-containing protein [Chryseotalea sanaruensis]
MKKSIFLITLILLCGFVVKAQLTVPELWGMRVHDEAKVLSAQTAQQLENVLKVFEDSTTNQIAVLIIPSLEGESVEDYALKVAEAWKLGTEKNDNGVLLLISINDRKMRIEVGEGLEGPLPDALCSRIIRNEIAPAFRRQDYDAGIMAGVNSIMLAIKGEYNTENNAGGENSLDSMSTRDRVLIGLFVFGILFVFTFLALFTPGCAGWGLYAFLIPFYGTFPLVVLGVNGGLAALATYALGLPILKMILPKTAWGKTMAEKMKNNNRGNGGGWSGGGGWFIGGGSGGGWSGGGGFSGGGGSFGGGGSSGSW